MRFFAVLITSVLGGPFAFHVEGFPSVERAIMVVLVDLDMDPVPLKWIFLDIGIDFREYVRVVGSS